MFAQRADRYLEVSRLLISWRSAFLISALRRAPFYLIKYSRLPAYMPRAGAYAALTDCEFISSDKYQALQPQARCYCVSMNLK